jgi:hypothetical protein
MASTKAFNGLMQQFLDELSKSFTGESRLQFYARQFPLLCEANPKKPMEVFVATYGGHLDKIRNKDPSLFEDVPKLFEDIDIRHMWQSCDEATREAIWKYLQHLGFMATTVSMIPPEMLSAIETVAMDAASKVEQGSFDPNQILAMLPQLMSSLPNMGGSA